MGLLQQDYLPQDLEPHLRRHGITGCLAVQAAQDINETQWLLQLSDQYPFIEGVVGWIDLKSDTLQRDLLALAQHPRLCGIRHVAQDEPDDCFLVQPEVVRGIAAIGRAQLTYDILIYERQFPAAIQLVGQLDQQPFILDHLGKPQQRGGDFETWAQHLREFARAPNVFSKLSGLVTEFPGRQWTKEHLRRYLDEALKAFSPHRLLFGSDWPVCRLAAEYAQVVEIIEDWSNSLSVSERHDLFGATARRVYRLNTKRR